MPNFQSQVPRQQTKPIKPRDREIRKPPVAVITSSQHQRDVSQGVTAKPCAKTQETVKAFTFEVKPSNARVHRRQVVATSNKGRRPEQSTYAPQ